MAFRFAGRRGVHDAGARPRVRCSRRWRCSPRRSARSDSARATSPSCAPASPRSKSAPSTTATATSETPDFGGVRQSLFTVRRPRAQARGDDRSRPATPTDGAARRSSRERPTRRISPSSTRAATSSSVTTTLNDSFGNARVAPGLGFLWNNEMDDFATRPGEKNLYGLIQGDGQRGRARASGCSPRCARRSRSSPGRNAFVWGTPGGSTILTTNFQVMLGVRRRDASRSTAAVAEPRFHQQDYPDGVEVERGRFDAAWIDGARSWGTPSRSSDARARARSASDASHAIAPLADGRTRRAWPIRGGTAPRSSSRPSP